jgi:signal transduction histidine kinase
LAYVRGIEKAEERVRIMKDLHDGLGAQLTRLAILAQGGNHATAAREPAESRLRQLSELARETVVQLKEMIWINRPGDESLEGLVSRICQYAEDALRPAGIGCRFELATALPPHPLRIEARHHLFNASKEALNNILKHSAATHVTITIQAEGGAGSTFTLKISDNGDGFDPDMALGRGHGLDNMRKRIEAVGGQFSLASRPGHGTELKFELPLRALKR